jgi:geranylgeranyl reductase family protein
LTDAQLRDVVVIGAGPAGSITARLLAEQGHDVVLLEEHAQAGQPVHCTGLLGLEAFDEFQLPRELILQEAHAARFSGGAGKSISVRSHRVNAAVIDRARLDAHLARRARSAGVDLRCGWRAETIAITSRNVTVDVRAGDAPPVRARACVLACGASYRFHRQLGLGLPDVFLQSAQLETPFPDWPEIEVCFGREVAPSGFAWVVPFKRSGTPYARIGLMSDTRSGERFGAFAASLCARAGVPASDLAAPRQKMLPLGPVGRTFGDRVVAVGDAAGIVKPTTGGGIYYGLLSGTLAAETLGRGLREDRLDARFLRRYEARWRTRLGQEIRIGLAFRRIAQRLSDTTIDALIDLARVNGIVPLLQEKASFNWHRKAAVALLADPSFRNIVFKSGSRSADSI